MNKKQTFNYKLFLATRKFLAMSIAFCLVATLFLAFLAYPRISTILQVRKKIDTEATKLSKYQTKARELDQLTTLAEFQQSETVNQVLPSHKPLLELIANLNQTAKDNEIAISDFSLSPGRIASQGAQIADDNKKSITGYDIMEVKFAANGQLRNLENFLQKIEQLSPITSIVSMSLNRQEQEVDNEVLVSASADLVLGVHYYSQSVQTTVEAPLPKIGQAELAVLDTIVGFGGTEIEKQTTIKDGGNENPFGITNWEEVQEELEGEENINQSELNSLIQDN